jgi:hypothetical protein
MKPVEEYEGQGRLEWPGEPGRLVGYRLTRLQGMAANGLPVPGLFRIEGDLDLRDGPVPDAVVGSPVTLRLDDGRSIGVTLTTREGRVLSEGHGPRRCLCC